MRLDDLDRREERRRRGGECRAEHGAEREVGDEHGARACGIHERPDERDALGRPARCADEHVDAPLDGGADDVDRDGGRRCVHDQVGAVELGRARTGTTASRRPRSRRSSSMTSRMMPPSLPVPPTMATRVVMASIVSAARGASGPRAPAAHGATTLERMPTIIPAAGRRSPRARASRRVLRDAGRQLSRARRTRRCSRIPRCSSRPPASSWWSGTTRTRMWAVAASVASTTAARAALRGEAPVSAAGDPRSRLGPAPDGGSRAARAASSVPPNSCSTPTTPSKRPDGCTRRPGSAGSTRTTTTRTRHAGTGSRWLRPE